MDKGDWSAHFFLADIVGLILAPRTNDLAQKYLDTELTVSEALVEHEEQAGLAPATLDSKLLLLATVAAYRSALLEMAVAAWTPLLGWGRN